MNTSAPCSDAIADAFAAVCAYHSSLQTTLKQLRFLEFMQPVMLDGSVFRVDPQLLKNMIAEIERIQRVAGGAGGANADAQFPEGTSAAGSWSDGVMP
jgi:hypothetical protein